eukprot:TRINITY_DN10008_c0_g1_i1.p1 TRINITY_DN10008_c0_g1~~TRINITY_DN10008_c0_g1_i1.p1  ORF type:complete len:106 (+),score=9.08 TRINITY_DN10008_c0_g1_i1:258-575(+)
MYYNNKIVWITGGSSGIGEAMAKQLNEEGATIIISSRRMEELQRVKKSCKYPEKVECVVLDVTDIAAVNDADQKTDWAISSNRCFDTKCWCESTFLGSRNSLICR